MYQMFKIIIIQALRVYNKAYHIIIFIKNQIVIVKELRMNSLTITHPKAC
jgi:hypothetical protein